MICLSGLLVGCANQPPQIITEYEILRLTKIVFVPISDTHTEPVPVEYVPDGPVDTIDYDVTLKSCQKRTQQCNGKLAEIAGIEGTEKQE